MNRRQAMAAIGTAGGLALVRDAAAIPLPVPELKVTVVIPELCTPDGKIGFPRILRNAGYGSKFFAVVQNVSKGDVYLWAEGNSVGNETLSIEVTEVNGAKTVVKRAPMDYGKNVIRAERLRPGDYQVRSVEYDTPADKKAQWEKFPFGAKESRREVTLRAIFEQRRREQPNKGELLVWSGKIVSEPLTVVLLNA